MRHFQWPGVSASLDIIGAALVAIWGLRLWRWALTRKQEVRAARASNKEACDSFICRNGLPDCQSIVLAFNGVARKEARKQYWDPSCQQELSDGLRRRSSETYIVPDDIGCEDRAMCERWLAVHIELHERRCQQLASSLMPLSKPKHGAWKPPPLYALVGCSTTRDQNLWRRCLDKIEAEIASEESQQSLKNMRACLEWVRLYGYPSNRYSLVWAACGIATCTTQREFSRFWAAHGQSPERKSVYAMGVVYGRDKVVSWRYGLAAANLGAPPLQLGYEQTWPEHFVSPEWLDEIYRYPWGIW